MRLAVIVAPLAPLGTQMHDAAPPSSTMPGLPVALERSGFRIVNVSTSPDLERDFEAALTGVSDRDDVLVHLAVSTVYDGDALALRTAVDRTLRLAIVGQALAVREPASVLFLVDARHDGAPDDAMLAADHADAVVRGLDARARGFSVLVGVRSEEASATAPTVWPFTRLVMRAIADGRSKDDDGAASVSRIYSFMRAMPDLGTFVQSYALVRGRTDFELVAAPVVLPSSRPPQADADARPPPSLGPSSLARPHVMPLLLGADEACQREDWDEALDAYKKALMLVGPDDARSHATIYSDIGVVKRAQGKPREAELFFEKALLAVPGHRRSIEALIALAIEAKDPKRIVEHRMRLVRALEDRELRVKELLVIASLHAEELQDARAAIDALERALELSRDNLEVLRRLVALHESMHRWPKVVETLAAICDATPSKVDRAGVRFAQADIALGRMRDEPKGLELLESALDFDPRHDRALHALVAVRTSRQEWAALDQAYARLVDRYAKLGDKERAWDACRKLGALRRDRLRDGPGAIEAFRGAVELKPNDAESRAMLADLYLAKGEVLAAVTEFETIAVHAPTRASTYQRLFVLHTKGGQKDRAWLAAQALEELAHTDMAQQLLLEQFRPEGSIRPSRFLDDAAWDSYLRAPGADEVVTGILGAIVPAAVKAKVAALREKRQLVELDPRTKQSPASTASIVRSFAWASQALGVTLPELYLIEDVPGGIAAAQVEIPSTAIGPALLSGLSAQDLAFLAGRHLAYYRPEHYALVFFPTLHDVSALFLSAVKLALPEVPVPLHLADAVVQMRRELAKHVTQEEREWLGAAVRDLEERGGRVDLAGWIRSVELSAGRAGLLLAGDLKIAVRRVRAESRAIADVTADERRSDMLAFCASPQLAELRARMSVTARPSTRPPPL